jgi:drug/metabolite transporter (DMT)-like permease
MLASSKTDRAGVVAGFTLPFFAGVALIFGSGMIQHWHQPQPVLQWTWSRIVFDAALALGVVCIIPSLYRRALRKNRLEGAGESAEVEYDERVRHIQGQAALFAMAVMILALGLFPMFEGLFHGVSSESLANAAMLILLASWIGRALWLNRD